MKGLEVEIEYDEADEAGVEGAAEGLEGMMLRRRRDIRKEISERLVKLPARMMESSDPRLVQEGTALYMLMQEEMFYNAGKARGD